MCGIVGFANYQYDHKINIEKMKNRMLHRGPDSEGSFFSEDGNLAFGHRRLSIVDISDTGAQPMRSHDGRYVCVFNGEIYNHRTLKEELINNPSLNITESDFNGTSDTEVMLEMFSAYGIEESLLKMKGMFGIALYDTKDKTLYLMRDRIGEKPLYYGRVGEAFVFASDLGSISVLDGFNNDINTDILDVYFINGYIPAPYTIYRGINKLLPGSLLKIKAPFTSDCHVEVKTYWDLKEVAYKGQTNKFKGSFNDAVDELDRLMKDSIRDQMVADVPVGAFLSAGIDSSATVAVMQSLNPNKVRSFTIGMEDPKYNEAVYAKEIANHLGTEHTELYITEDDAKAVIPKIGYMFGEPFADSSQIPTYLVSKMTREHVTVSLSGDGGDELFCGYTSYASVDRIWNKMRKVPYIVRKPASKLALTLPMVKKNQVLTIKSTLLAAKGPEDLYNRSRECDPGIGRISLSKVRAKCNNDLFEPDYLGEINHDIMLMDMMMYHPDDILVKVDRTAMAVSLETRVPMLDKDVVEFAWSLPIEYLREDGDNAGVVRGKYVLRELLYRYVPKEMMERPKKGFSIPIDQWLKNDPKLHAWAEELLVPQRIRSQGYLNAEVVTAMWKDLNDKDIWRPQIWFVLMFQQWMLENKRIVL